MKRLRGLTAALAVTITVIGLAAFATAASVQTITRAQTTQQDPCAGISPSGLKQLCDVSVAITNVWAKLEKSSQPQTEAQWYLNSFAYAKDCGTGLVKGDLGNLLTLSQWKQILGGILQVLSNRQIQNFWDRYQEIRDFPLAPWGGCFPPASVIKATHPALWSALSHVWLAPVVGGAVILPAFFLPNGSARHAPVGKPAAPSGLTVRANPGNGTVLRLSWHNNANNAGSFQVNNGVISRDVSAHSGTKTVNYTWTGLKPGSRACFKVRATNVFGASAWDPNAEPWHVCAYVSSHSPRPCTPKIDAVRPAGANAGETLDITGTCFGTGNTSSAADTRYFRVSDLTANWNACWTGDPGTDQVTCNISSWTNTTIIFSGFTGAFGQNGWVIGDGDHIDVQVWNPQSGKGPAICELVAGSAAPTDC